MTTARGGQHRYDRMPRRGPVLGNTASRVAPFVDTRGLGGYVVAPPTVTADGRYRIVDGRPPARLPSWFAELLIEPDRPRELLDPVIHRPPSRSDGGARARYVAAAVAGEVHRLALAGPGTRNTTLFTVAVALGQLVGAGLLDPDDARQCLLDSVGAHIAAGAYSHRQAASTIASGLHRGAQQPRRLPPNLTTSDASAAALVAPDETHGRSR